MAYVPGFGVGSAAQPTTTPVTPAEPIVLVKDLREPREYTPNYRLDIGHDEGERRAETGALVATLESSSKPPTSRLSERSVPAHLRPVASSMPPPNMRRAASLVPPHLRQGARPVSEARPSTTPSLPPAPLHSAPAHEPKRFDHLPLSDDKDPDDETATPPMVRRTGSRVIPKGRNDMYKVPWRTYAGRSHCDLGLCDLAFRGDQECSRGAQCMWRHHEINDEEFINNGWMKKHEVQSLRGRYYPQIHLLTRWDMPDQPPQSPSTMFTFKPSEPNGVSQSKHAGIPPSREHTDAALSMYFKGTTPSFSLLEFGLTGKEPGGGTNGEAPETSAAELRASPQANLFPSLTGGGLGATSRPSLFAAAPKASSSFFFQNAAPSTATQIPSSTNLFSSTADGVSGTASTGGASKTSTAAPKARGLGGNLFGGATPLYGGGGFSVAPTIGMVFSEPTSMDSPNHASGAPRTSAGGSLAGELFGDSIFSAPRTFSNGQDGLFGRPASKYEVPDKRVSIDQAIDLGSTILTITAGEAERQRTFTIHENLIASRSTYIKTFIAEHPEAKTIKLGSADPNAFHLYTHLVYFNSIPSLPLISDNAQNHEEYCLLAKLYVLGVAMQDRFTKNAAIDAMFAKAQGGTDFLPSSEHVWILYKGTSGPCGARKMLVDFYAAKASMGSMQGQEFPTEFINDLAMSFVAERSVASSGLVVKGGVGVYHE